MTRLCSLRDLNKTTFMDVLYYLSTTYGQRIVSSVTRQLNDQYQAFMKMHPGKRARLISTNEDSLDKDPGTLRLRNVILGSGTGGGPHTSWSLEATVS